MNFTIFVILHLFFSFAYGHSKDCVKINGKQYLKRPYKMSDFIKNPNENIFLQFKTSKPDGLLLYFKGGPTSYVLLKLHNGKIVFEVDFGTGNVSAAVPSDFSVNLDDRKWHDVVVKRRWKNVNISVDHYSQVSVEIPLNITQLLLKPPSTTVATAMYIFGGPPDIRYPVNFKGLINDLVMNNRKPILSYFLKHPAFTLHGSGKLKKHHCHADL